MVLIVPASGGGALMKGESKGRMHAFAVQGQEQSRDECVHAPLIGKMKPAPTEARTSRTGKSKGSGTPRSFASWEKEYCVLAMQIGILSKPNVTWKGVRLTPLPRPNNKHKAQEPQAHKPLSCHTVGSVASDGGISSFAVGDGLGAVHLLGDGENLVLDRSVDVVPVEA